MVNEARKRGMVVLAQLVEHRIVVPSVVGSSPTFHPRVNNRPIFTALIR